MPLVKLVFPFLAGIAAYLMAGWRLPWTVFAALYGLIILFWQVFQHYWLAHFSRRWVFGLAAGIMMLVAGYQLSQQHDQRYHPGHFSHREAGSAYLRIRISEPVSGKANSFQVVGQVTHIVCAGKGRHAQPVKGRLMLYLAKDSLAAGLKYGDVLLTSGRYEAVRGPQNPQQFDYRRFLMYRNIHHIAYRQSGQWQATGGYQGNRVMKLALKLRERALEVFTRHGLADREFAVVSALLLGYREHLDEDLQREFAGAGAMHILCVSGLHVGIIYLIIKSLLSFMHRMPAGRLLQTLITLILIWLYAAITGFSPSVLRASAMFSFVAAGNCLNRQTNIYNTLAASALVLMAADPYIITRIGFQLSYLAVIGIVALQPRICSLITFKYKLPARAWALMAVSVAAQMATGPLALYYFHQFPNYFLLTNLVVIPLAGLIIYSALLTLVLAMVFPSFPMPGFLASRLLNTLLYTLHESVRLIEGLPHATLNNIHITLPETLLLFMFLFLGCFYLLFGRRQMLIPALLALLVMVMSLSVRGVANARREFFVVYSLNNATAIDFFGKRSHLCLGCDRVMTNPRQLDFQAQEFRISRGLKRAPPVIPLNGRGSLHTGTGNHPGAGIWFSRYETDFLHREDGFVKFSGKRIFLVHEMNRHMAALPAESEEVFPVDYLVVTQNINNNPEAWLKTFVPRKVIVDASNNFNTTRIWQEACMEFGIDCWPVRTKGAFVQK